MHVRRASIFGSYGENVWLTVQPSVVQMLWVSTVENLSYSCYGFTTNYQNDIQLDEVSDAAFLHCFIKQVYVWSKDILQINQVYCVWTACSLPAMGQQPSVEEFTYGEHGPSCAVPLGTFHPVSIYGGSSDLRWTIKDLCWLLIHTTVYAQYCGDRGFHYLCSIQYFIRNFHRKEGIALLYGTYLKKKKRFRINPGFRVFSY